MAARKRRDDDPECLCDTKATRGYSLYYDTPDGCDIPTKVMVTTRYGLLAGMIMSTYDVLMYSHTVGLGNILSKYMQHILPLTAMGATFVVVSNGAMHYRQKDDPWNYFLGGFACGPIVAHYLGSKHGVLVGGLALGVIGSIKKTGVEEGWVFNPDIPPHRGSIRRWRYDFTMAKDPKDDAKNKCPNAI